MLDDDLYKFTMGNAIQQLYPEAIATYKFFNRGNHKFNQKFAKEFFNYIKVELPKLALTDDEMLWFKNTCSFIHPIYFEWLKSFRYNPSDVNITFSNNYQDMDITICGTWYKAVLWEVKLMAIISELYFKYVDNKWLKVFDESNWIAPFNEKRQLVVTYPEAFKYADFATRRRRSSNIHDYVTGSLKNTKQFVGTSNVYLAKKYKCKPIGTMAHEFIMGVSELESLRYANKHALYKWADVYKGNLGIALTDTFGTDGFLKDFDLTLAKLYDGVRQDSGNPYEFAEKMITHYKKLNINPMTKTIIFSDALNFRKAFDIFFKFSKRINCSFGIGTYLSNDCIDSPAMNMVIKLVEINGIPVVKISDTKGKVTGNKDDVKYVKYVYGIK